MSKKMTIEEHEHCQAMWLLSGYLSDVSSPHRDDGYSEILDSHMHRCVGCRWLACPHCLAEAWTIFLYTVDAAKSESSYCNAVVVAKKPPHDCDATSKDRCYNGCGGTHNSSNNDSDHRNGLGGMRYRSPYDLSGRFRFSLNNFIQTIYDITESH